MKIKAGLTGAVLTAVVVACVIFEGYSLAKSLNPSISVVGKPENQAQEVNVYRSRHDLPTLNRDKRLEEEAYRTALSNASHGRLFHFRGKEIIAYNYTGFHEAIEQWDESRDHHAHLNNPYYTRCGCACVRNGDVYFCCVRFE